MLSYAKFKTKHLFWKVPQVSQFSWIILDLLRASIRHEKEISREFGISFRNFHDNTFLISRFLILFSRKVL